uniref:Ubiquinol-cytochrome c chaperone domain-containing protein n=2 Tax=Guillardia theta TaxID=55529 RepID=A0A7S4KIP2_GUITH
MRAHAVNRVTEGWRRQGVKVFSQSSATKSAAPGAGEKSMAIPSAVKSKIIVDFKPTSSIFETALRLVGFYSKESKITRSALNLYLNARQHADNPNFLKHFGMPNDFNKQFCIISIHMWMIFVRLRKESVGKQLSQEVFDNLWFDAQKHLKNLGVGVLSLNARTRDLQNVFYGSAVAFDFSLGTSDALLAMALYRNIFSFDGDAHHVGMMVAYIRRELNKLEMMDSDTFLGGMWEFSMP